MATSYNGWEASPDPSAIDVDPGFRAAGCAFPGGARAGDVATVQGYVIDQLAARVEAPLLDPDTGAPGYGCWGYNYRANVNNPSTLSCHSSATALDWNAPAHPNGAVGTFSDAQRATIYDILAEVGGAVQWGGDYTGTVDEMHFEIIVDAGTLAGVAAGLTGGGYTPDMEDDMPLTDEDVTRIADRVWSQIISEAGGVPAWRLLLDARDVMASTPAALAPQTVADAIAQTRNDVADLK
jgi:D-alanyl-D-alanine carboxypeptidase